MKNFMKAMICALTITAAAAIPAMVSARDNQDVYVSDSSVLILREQADENSDVVLYAEGSGYELHVQDFLNGFGYCYSPDFGVNGWVDTAMCLPLAHTDGLMCALHIETDLRIQKIIGGCQDAATVLYFMSVCHYKEKTGKASSQSELFPFLMLR